MFGGWSSVDNNGVLKYEQTISLQRICAVNIVTKLWINETVELEKNIYEFKPPNEIENIILSKIKQLSLPKTIIDQLASFSEYVGNSLRSWIEFHDQYLFECYFHSNRKDKQSMDYLHLIKFTNNGMIDLLQTAKNIAIKERNFEIKYKLASQYCLEEEFANISAEIKEEFFQSFVDRDLNIEEDPMLFYWTYLNMNGHSLLHELIDNDRNLSEYILEAVIDYNSIHFEVAVKYLWSKLTNTEKSKNVISVIEGFGNPTFRYSLISSLDCKHQQMIFRDISLCNFLNNMLLDLMWRDCFVSTICQIFHMLDPHIYYQLLSELTDIINYHLNKNDGFYNTQCYKQIFKTLWGQTPYHFKDYVFKFWEGEGLIYLICLLMSDVNFELIQMLLADMPEIEKKYAIFSSLGLIQCTRYIIEEQWELLDLFTKSFLVLDENRIVFKEYVISKSVMEICIHHLEQDKWDKLTYFLKWAFKSDDEITNFKKSIRITKNMYNYDIYYSQNGANKYSWNLPSEESMKRFQKFFFSVDSM